MDDLDALALHVMLKKGDDLLAYARIVPADDPAYMSFGRVLVPKQYRHLQLGRRLVTTTLAEVAQCYPDKGVKIAGQAYLQAFYQSFGFRPVSDLYLEDGIPHLDLVLAPPAG